MMGSTGGPDILDPEAAPAHVMGLLLSHYRTLTDGSHGLL